MLLINNLWLIKILACAHIQTLYNIASNLQTSKTPLQEAIDNEHIEVTKLLMKALTEVNQKVETPTGKYMPT